jgi:hypothetical protein
MPLTKRNGEDRDHNCKAKTEHGSNMPENSLSGPPRSGAALCEQPETSRPGESEIETRCERRSRSSIMKKMGAPGIGAEKRRQYGSEGAFVFRDPYKGDRVGRSFDWDLEGSKSSRPSRRSRRSCRRPGTRAGRTWRSSAEVTRHRSDVMLGARTRTAATVWAFERHLVQSA